MKRTRRRLLLQRSREPDEHLVVVRVLNHVVARDAKADKVGKVIGFDMTGKAEETKRNDVVDIESSPQLFWWQAALLTHLISFTGQLLLAIPIWPVVRQFAATPKRMLVAASQFFSADDGIETVGATAKRPMLRFANPLINAKFKPFAAVGTVGKLMPGQSLTGPVAELKLVSLDAIRQPEDRLSAASASDLNLRHKIGVSRASLPLRNCCRVAWQALLLADALAFAAVRAGIFGLASALRTNLLTKRAPRASALWAGMQRHLHALIVSQREVIRGIS